jgi:putative sterol carrier protein
MPFYPNAEAFYTVMIDLFGRIIAAPEMAQRLADSRAVLCIRTAGPAAILHLNTRKTPPSFLTGNACGKDVDLGLSVAADTLHAIWLGRMRMSDAFASGKIRLETNPLRALALQPKFEAVFRFAEQVYPAVLRERGLL